MIYVLTILWFFGTIFYCAQELSKYYAAILYSDFKVIILSLNQKKSHSSSPPKYIAIIILVVPGIHTVYQSFLQIISFWLSFQSDQLDSKQIFTVIKYSSIFTHLILLAIYNFPVRNHRISYFNQIWPIQSSLDQVIVPRNSRRE